MAQCFMADMSKETKEMKEPKEPKETQAPKEEGACHMPEYAEHPDTLLPPAADSLGHGSDWLVAIIDTPRVGERAAKELRS